MSRAATQQGKPLDVLKTEMEIAKLQVEAGKLFAETQKINRENRWAPLLYVVAFLTAAAAFGKLFVH